MNVGDQINHWTIIRALPISRGKARNFLCRCICGKERNVFQSHLKRGTSRSCGCITKGGNKNYKWSGCGQLTGDHWNQIVRNATGKKKRNPIGISLTIEEAWNLFLEQKGLCALTGQEICLGKRGKATASLDRIDPNKGYHLDNVQWVHKDINRMKNIFQQDYFIKVCKLVNQWCEI
jgi:hypothetical protein